MVKLKLTGLEVLDNLIRKEGIADYIRDYNSACGGHLKILYARENFYIAEDTIYQPWLSVMGDIPKNIKKQELDSLLRGYIKEDKYIAAYTNIKQVSDFLQKTNVFSYHEDFWVALLSDVQEVNESGIRLATAKDLAYIEGTYKRSGHKQLLNRITKNQMWILEEEARIKGYAGIHKDGSLGFEYVDPASRRRNIASRLQIYIAKRMQEENLIPYVMISKENAVAKNLQTKLKCAFAKNMFCFYAKGAYEFE